MNATQTTTVDNSIIDGFDQQAVDMLRSGIDLLGLTVSEQQMARLLRHLSLLERWNRKLNLTAIVSPKEMVVQHVLDSLALVTLVEKDSLLDIGTGGGFPGMPLAIMNPESRVGLLDTRGKRIEFLRFVIGANRLTNVTGIKSRVQDYQPPQKFDTLVTRAFSALGDMIEWTSDLQQPGCRLLAMKGRKPDQEIAALDQHWQNKVRVHPLTVPYLDAERHVIEIVF